LFPAINAAVGEEWLPAPAVGEKKSDELRPAAEETLWTGACLLSFPVGADNRSNDIVLAPNAPPPYGPDGLDSLSMESFRCDAIAALRTLLCSDQATRPRHVRTAAPMKPRMAPTTMKTVPSGRFDRCMNGAPAVHGTIGVGIP
jgi:hypothetical protein